MISVLYPMHRTKKQHTAGKKKAADIHLPPKCREVFRLSYIEDLSNREIGEQLGISPRTVENHMYAALKQLRRKLSKEQLLLLLSLLFMRGV